MFLVFSRAAIAMAPYCQGKSRELSFGPSEFDSGLDLIGSSWISVGSDLDKTHLLSMARVGNKSGVQNQKLPETGPVQISLQDTVDVSAIVEF